MDVEKAIKKRRSIRKYEDKEVPDELVHELLDAARRAPSGNNAQPWKFRVFKTKEEKELLKENGIFKQDFVYSAPVIILCCGDPRSYPEHKIDEMDDKNKLRAVRDLAFATENIVLRATELGLGTCYIGWMDKDKIKRLFDLPDRYVAPYVVLVGYPAEESEESSRKSLDEIILG